jgi:hypothetical protein
MAGYWLNARTGAIAYNAVHSYVGPLALAGAALAGMQLVDLDQRLVGLCVHLDRSHRLRPSAGYGLKYPEGFKSTHLGLLGKRVEA